MTTLSYALVLVATLTHAYWNFLLKRAGGGQVFVGASKVAEAILLLPLFLFVGWQDASLHTHALMPLIIVGALLSLGNYIALGIAYTRADLSYVYPISRGAILLFVPLLGYAVFHERPATVGYVGIAVILVGIAVLPAAHLTVQGLRDVGARAFRSGGSGYALLAAAAAAGYTIWDKRAVGVIQPFTYFYCYTVLVALAYAGFLLQRDGMAALRAECVMQGRAILQVAVLNSVTYMLVLYALRDGISSYVIAIRQLSIAFGVLLGWRILGETMTPGRKAGVLLIVVGTVLVCLAR